MNQNGFKVRIIHAEKIEVDELVHSLPNGISVLDEYKVKDYYCPENWSRDGSFISVTEDMPLWFDFRNNDECACLVSIQKVNPLTGEPADLEKGLSNTPLQNYLYLPEQKWLDGYSKEGKVYQFRVTKKGESLAVNEFVLPVALQDSHVLAFAFFRPKVEKRIPHVVINSYPIWFNPLHTPRNWEYSTPKKWEYPILGTFTSDRTFIGGNGTSSCSLNGVQPKSEEPNIQQQLMTIGSDHNPDEAFVTYNNIDELNIASMGAGGRIEQRITSDFNSIDYYEEKPIATLLVYMALPELFNKIMSAGPVQNPHKKDKFINSGKVGNTFVPLIK